MDSKDLFEDVRHMLGLPYISDIRLTPNVQQAIAVLRALDLQSYSLPMLSDMAYYIKGQHQNFGDCQSAIAFFENA